MFGINGGELIVLLLVVALVVGPGRLPEFAAQLAKLARTSRQYLARIRDDMAAEAGVEDVMDWTDLDPRKYDPRRIVRDALLNDDDAVAATSRQLSAPPARVERLAPGQRPPWDAEAT